MVGPTIFDTIRGIEHRANASEIDATYPRKVYAIAKDELLHRDLDRIATALEGLLTLAKEDPNLAPLNNPTAEHEDGICEPECEGQAAVSAGG
jgi:hypothetical protein